MNGMRGNELIRPCYNKLTYFTFRRIKPTRCSLWLHFFSCQYCSCAVHTFPEIFDLFISGTLRCEEAVAPLAGQPRPAGASGSSHVHPDVSHQDQLPQHQADHSCVTAGAQLIICTPTSERTDLIFLSGAKKTENLQRRLLSPNEAVVFSVLLMSRAISVACWERGMTSYSSAIDCQ